MTILIVVFLVLLMLLTGNLAGVLGFVGWTILVVLGVAILYLAVIDPIKRRQFKAAEQLGAENRGEPGYGPAPKSAAQEMRAKLGYGEPNEREV